MSQSACLIQGDLFGSEHSTVLQVVKVNVRQNSNQEEICPRCGEEFNPSFGECRYCADLARCKRCGEYVSPDNDICPHCLGYEFCFCRGCREIASLLRMLHGELRKGRYNGFERGRKQKINDDIAKYKKMPCPVQEVAS